MEKRSWSILNRLLKSLDGVEAVIAVTVKPCGTISLMVSCNDPTSKYTESALKKVMAAIGVTNEQPAVNKLPI